MERKSKIEYLDSICIISYWFNGIFILVFYKR